jgi:hypothetical protein
MTKQVQRRRGTATQHTSFTGAEGETSVNTTNKSIHVHDGTTTGGFEAARIDLTNVTGATVAGKVTGSTLSSLTITSADINGGTVDNVAIGNTTPSSGLFTTLNASSTLTLGGTAVTSTAAELNILDGVTATAAELNVLDGVTATAAELNLVDGSAAGSVVINKAVIYSATGQVNATQLAIGGTAITSTAAELNILDGVTSTAAELNILDGVTATTAELNFVDGVTSNVQTQLNTKAPLASPAFTGAVSFTGGGVQFPTQLSNSFTPNAQRADLLFASNPTSNNAFRIGSIASNAGVTLQGTRANNSGLKVDLVLQPDGGNVGIGTTSPDGKLHIQDGSAGVVTAADGANDLVIETSQTSGMSILCGAGWACIIQFGGGTDNNIGNIGVNDTSGIMTMGTAKAGGTLALRTADAVNALTIDASQNLAVTSGNLSFANGQGIDFSATSGTGTSELFDDYEEGTWTPTGFTGGTLYNATYTKVGRLVTANMYVNATTFNSSVMGGLPFTSITGWQAGTLGLNNSTNANNCEVSTASTNITFRQGATSVTPDGSGLMVSVTYHAA